MLKRLRYSKFKPSSDKTLPQAAFIYSKHLKQRLNLLYKSNLNYSTTTSNNVAVIISLLKKLL